MMTRTQPHRFHLVYIRETVSGSISAPRDVDLCVCVFVFDGCALLHHLHSHRAVNWEQAPSYYSSRSPTRRSLSRFIAMWPRERSELTCLRLFPRGDMSAVECLILFKLCVLFNSWFVEAPNSRCASDENRRPADKAQTGHKLRTMVLHITHLFQLLWELFQEHCV